MQIPLNHNRSGLSLFEILAAMFILMVGLLGVLAVLPFGMYQMNRVNKAAFGGNCGRAAIQEIQVRNWAGNFEESLFDPFGNLSNAQGDLRCDRPWIVDPLLLAQNGNNDSQFSTFPLTDTDGLPRLWSRFPVNPPSLYPSLNDVRDVFCWQDDRNFAAPESPSVQVPRPVGVAPKGSIQSHENYSWLYMLTPIMRGLSSGTPFESESKIVGYEVDVVVFFNRDLSGATERAVTATRDGGGYRGGSFTLAGTNLDLTDTRWLLLSCQDGNKLFAKWYRIVSFGEIEGTGPFTRRVMLLGPDVPSSTAYSATLVQGAIHVYSTVIVK